MLWELHLAQPSVALNPLCWIKICKQPWLCFQWPLHCPVPSTSGKPTESQGTGHFHLLVCLNNRHTLLLPYCLGTKIFPYCLSQSFLLNMEKCQLSDFFSKYCMHVPLAKSGTTGAPALGHCQLASKLSRLYSGLRGWMWLLQSPLDAAVAITMLLLLWVLWSLGLGWLWALRNSVPMS